MKQKFVKTNDCCKCSEQLTPVTYEQKYIVTPSGHKKFCGLDLTRREDFYLGTTDINDVLGYQRYIELQSNNNSEQSPFIAMDALRAADIAIAIQNSINSND